MTGRGAEKTRSLASRIRAATGINAAKCYQCAKCSAGCPMAEEMPRRTHELLRLLQLDRAAELLRDESLWLCLTCETCTARCPNGVDPARVIDALREEALRLAAQDDDARPPRPVRAFHAAFLKQIRAHGRVFERGRVTGFKLRGGPLFADVTAAPAMMVRGKLPLAPRNIRGRADVRRIFAACADEGKGGAR
jgi:heterodisulfide reductase subunit C